MGYFRALVRESYIYKTQMIRIGENANRLYIFSITKSFANYNKNIKSTKKWNEWINCVLFEISLQKNLVPMVFYPHEVFTSHFSYFVIFFRKKLLYLDLKSHRPKKRSTQNNWQNLIFSINCLDLPKGLVSFCSEFFSQKISNHAQSPCCSFRSTLLFPRKGPLATM